MIREFDGGQRWKLYLNTGHNPRYGRGLMLKGGRHDA
jgi:hypothetical protein